MKKLMILTLVITLVAIDLNAFCGFYVAKADAKLFNKSSQIILVRDGGRTAVTMYSDYQGPVGEFAMVVPVPVILKESDIKVVNANIFARLDAYSGPRLVEYYDPSPCGIRKEMLRAPTMMKSMNITEDATTDDFDEAEELGVTIEAEYAIGEYDILILSATESSGLKKWLNQNEYKIPEGAEEVLDPYIKDDMKFFVVKVNLEKFETSGSNDLNPIQISFDSDNFMLPIRLGMANSETSQDMIVYAFTKKGRVECTNYKTRKIPTDKEIPTFVKAEFGKFYRDLFDRAYRKSRSSVYLEYAWDISSSNFVKCDPCATAPPVFSDFSDAGVWWVTNQYSGGSNYTGDVFFTRLHVRYDRKNFPQDLTFHITPNTETFQGRYIMNHPASFSMESCPEGKSYLKKLIKRRKSELNNLTALTGWNSRKYYTAYVQPYELMLNPDLLKPVPTDTTDQGDLPVNSIEDKVDILMGTSNARIEEFAGLDLLEQEGMEIEYVEDEVSESSIGGKQWIRFMVFGILISALIYISRAMRPVTK